MSVPYSRYLFGIIPWYSILIVAGAAAAIILAVREEKRTDLKKDTVIDFALVALPCGIIGARVYYVIFSWSVFKDDFWSVFKIWEGGIAIYGAVIAGLIAAFLFCRRRHIPVLTLCDIVAPGLVFAQALGRWGNYFNQEAYGLAVHNAALRFFPFAVQIQTESGLQWHMATFFYESVWNIIIFVFLLVARRKWFRYRGDVFFFYAFLYACGRLVIEDLRLDSLYASSNIRISQLLSVLICTGILLRYLRQFKNHPKLKKPGILLMIGITLLLNLLAVLCMTGIIPFAEFPPRFRLAVLTACCLLNTAAFLILYRLCSEGKLLYADNRN